MTKLKKKTRSQTIAKKLIYIFDIYAIKERAHAYTNILNQPKGKEEIYQKLLLHNIFAMRSKYDLGLIQHISQELFHELHSNMNQRKFEKIIINLIPEFDNPEKSYLDVFGKATASIDKNEIEKNRKFWMKYLEKDDLFDSLLEEQDSSFNVKKGEFYKIREESNSLRLKALNDLFPINNDENIYDTPTLAAIQDIFREYQTGIYVCQFLPSGYYSSFLKNYLNPNIQDSLKNFSELQSSLIELQKMYHLIGSQIGCVVLITKFLINALNANVPGFPHNFPKTEISLFSRHLYSVMLSILFNRKNLKTQINLMNEIFIFHLSPLEIQRSLKYSNLFKDMVKEDLQGVNFTKRTISYHDFYQKEPGSINLEGWTDDLKELYLIQHKLFRQNFLIAAKDIALYVIESYQNLKMKTLIIFKDALATIYRDLHDYKNALTLFFEIRKYWENQHNNYMIFLAKKNEAYLYAKLGEISYSYTLFDAIIQDINSLPIQQHGAIFQNLGTRFLLMHDYQKSYEFFQKALHKLPENSHRYKQVKKSLNPFEVCQDLSSKKINFVKVRKLYQNLQFKEYISKYQRNKNRLMPKIAHSFLETAYDWLESFDITYWLERIDLALMEQNWDEMENLQKKINRNAFLLPSLYCTALNFLYKDELALFWEKLEQIYFVYYVYHPDFKELRSETYNWNQINDREIRISIVNKLEDKLKESIKNSEFSKENVRNEVKQDVNAYNSDEIRSKLALNLCFMLSRTFIVDFNSKRQKVYLEMQISNIKSEFNLVRAHLLNIFKEIFYKRREWVIYEKIMYIFTQIHPHYRQIIEFGDYYYLNLQDYRSAVKWYLEAIKYNEHDPYPRERLIEVYTNLEEFTKAQLMLESLEDPKINQEPRKHQQNYWKAYIANIKNSKIRYSHIQDEDIIKILKTIEFQISQFYYFRSEFDFSYLYTLFSKVVEKLLANHLGSKILQFLKEKYPSPYDTYQKQSNSNKLFSMFLHHPSEHSPVLGNWTYIFKGYLHNYRQDNCVNKDIHQFLHDHEYLTREKINEIYSFLLCIKPERDKGSHRKIFTFPEIDEKIREIIPLLNIFLEIIKQI